MKMQVKDSFQKAEKPTEKHTVSYKKSKNSTRKICQDSLKTLTTDQVGVIYSFMYLNIYFKCTTSPPPHMHGGM